MRLTRKAYGAAVVAALALVTAAVPGLSASGATTPVADGMICTTSPSDTFSLTASAGYITTPDGNSVYMWTLSPTGSAFQFPGPVLCVTSGDTVTVVLHNSLPEPTSLTFPGQSAVKADGQPQVPASGPVTSLAKEAPTNGAVTYTFTAGSPGSYLYTSGSDVTKQNEMGLYGAIVVRPHDASGQAVQGQANDDPSSVFNPDREFLYLLSAIDPDVHLAVERKRAVSFSHVTPRYFLINGRSMPDTIAPNNAPWLPAQPYGALLRIQPTDPSNPRPALVRYVNAGGTDFPFHPHGANQRVLTRDGRQFAGPDGQSSQDLSEDKFLILVPPGGTADATLSWEDVDGFSPSNPYPVTLPNLQDQLIGPATDTWWSESPYLGYQGTNIPGVVRNNECGEYYHVAHSHALEQATNFGASFGGMMTLIRIDPPSSLQASTHLFCPGS